MYGLPTQVQGVCSLGREGETDRVGEHLPSGVVPQLDEEIISLSAGCVSQLGGAQSGSVPVSLIWTKKRWWMHRGVAIAGQRRSR
jgi:hypothetical protein